MDKEDPREVTTMFELIPHREHFYCLVIAAMLCLAFVGTSSGQTTSFTYQGRLTDGGMPANGSYDLQFTLWDSVTNGNQIGSTQTVSNVSVNGGIFTVLLDFGANAFSGPDRFLEISTRVSGGASFTLLSPRQPVTSTPYAVRSLNAGAADIATSATQLNGVAAANFVQTNDSRLTDARAPTAGSGNYIQNTSSIQASSNFNISGNGVIGGSLVTQGSVGIGVSTPTEILHLQKSGSAAILLDVGTTSNTGQLHIKRGNGNSYIGPTDTGFYDFWTFENIPIRIAQNGLERIRVDNNGNVGIGTTIPTARLDVAGGINASTQFNLGGSRVLSADGTNNIFAGVGAGAVNMGTDNTFVGFNAGNANTTNINFPANENSFFGSRAGESNTTGIRNTFFGAMAGRFNTTGNDNCIFGDRAGVLNNGSANAIFGTGAGIVNSTGSINSFFGRNAGNLNTTGANNSFFGGLAGNNNTTGSNNSFFGESAGLSNTAEGNNTFIGANTNGLAGITNAAAIGANASVTQSNSLILGSINGVNGGTANTNVGIGTTAPEQLLSVAGAVVIDQGNQNTGTSAFGLTFGHASGEGIASKRNGGGNQFGLDFYTQFVSRMSIAQSGEVSLSVLPAGSFPLCRNAVNQIGDCASSLRYKKDVASFGGGLNIVNRLRPISYTWKDHDERDLGLGAEEVAAIEPRLVTRNGKGEIQGVKYDRLTAVLVNAIKQQEQQIDHQQNQIGRQQVQVESLLRANAAVNARLRILERALKKQKDHAGRLR
jgi:Chaperone of endosialidase